MRESGWSRPIEVTFPCMETRGHEMPPEPWPRDIVEEDGGPFEWWEWVIGMGLVLTLLDWCFRWGIVDW